MPRKVKLKKQKITVLVNGTPISVTLHPPSGVRKSWYAFWCGLTTSKSTGHTELEDAIKAVEDMLQNGGQKSQLSNTVLSDEEFEEIQRRHFGKKLGAEAQKRAQSSLRECLDAISAFRSISGRVPVVLATPDDCERFQRQALEKPRNWRIAYADNKQSKKRRERQDPVGLLSPSTVVKWTKALQAAFERVNRNSGKKCVRGVVAESKLLSENPWHKFTGIEGSKKAIRHFDAGELLSLMDYFDKTWPGITVAPAFAKVLLWSWARREEISSLTWAAEHSFGVEHHFESTGKWAVKKWFRIPELLRAELESLRSDSSFVFGCYPEQLTQFYIRRGNRSAAKRVRPDFAPENLGEWVYQQVRNWSQTLPKGAAYLHVFRKTSLQHALTGEHIAQKVAQQAHLTAEVMQASYAPDSDEEYRHMSNQTFRRIRSSLPVDVAVRYGCAENAGERIMEQLDAARSQGDWEGVARLAAKLRLLEQQTA